MQRVLLAVVMIGLCGALTMTWARLDVVEGRLALREQQLANHQAVLEAIARTGKLRDTDLEPHLGALRYGAPTSYEEGFSWDIHVPDRRADTTDFPAASVEFGKDGRLKGVYAYKP